MNVQRPEGVPLRPEEVPLLERPQPSLDCCTVVNTVLNTVFSILKIPENFFRGGVGRIAKEISEASGAGERVAKITVIGLSVLTMSISFIAIYEEPKEKTEYLITFGTRILTVITGALASLIPIDSRCPLSMPSWISRINVSSLIAMAAAGIVNPNGVALSKNFMICASSVALSTLTVTAAAELRSVFVRNQNLLAQRQVEV